MAAELTKAEQNALCASYDVMGTHVELDLPFVKKYLVRGRSELVSDQEIVFFINSSNSTLPSVEKSTSSNTARTILRRL